LRKILESDIADLKEVIETKWNKSSAFALLSTLQNLVMNQNLRDIK